MAEEAKNPPVSDPDNIPELLCNGRIFVNWAGDLGIITFTQERPAVGAMFDRDDVSLADAVVRARIVMSLGNMRALRDLLNRVIKDGPAPAEAPAPGSASRH